MAEVRPDPDQLLERIHAEEARERRGRLRIFFGASAGVGKTYAMLEAARNVLAAATDVVVGYVEPHGRLETERLLEGLPRLPTLPVSYRGIVRLEFDLDAALARRPEILLVDELAHSNITGGDPPPRHPKRWQDIEELLAAGISVWTTVNVQHLESLNDQVTRLTGSITRETIPDEVLSGADEVVLIDLTPEALIARLRAGKVYRPERVQAALNNFFKIENLSALRETALRQVAEDVEVKRLVREPQPLLRRDQEGVLAPLEAPPQAIAERLLALVTLAPHSERIVRRAWRSSQRLDAGLDVLVVRPPGRPPSQEDRRRLEELRRLVSMLGARLRVEEGEDVAVVAIRVARSLGATYVLMGTPSAPRGLARLGGGVERSLLLRLLRGLPGVDVRVVADPTLRTHVGEGAIDEQGAGVPGVLGDPLSEPAAD